MAPRRIGRCRDVAGRGQAPFGASPQEAAVAIRRRGGVMKRVTAQAKRPPTVYERNRRILESARTSATRSVNTTQVVANWLIAREIVEEKQKGKRRAGYGEELIVDLARRLTADYGQGYSKDNLFWFRRLYQGHPKLVDLKFEAARQISDTLPRKSTSAVPGSDLSAIRHALRGESWYSYFGLPGARRERATHGR